jgi:aryl-alcohol dehydrogenase-like predicted oxidoreductase
MSHKIALGTAQFGLPYGINNRTGQVPPQEVEKILLYARENGIDTIDTARAYGESEEVLGLFLERPEMGFRIVTKYPPGRAEKPKALLKESFERLHIKKVYAYLFHNFKIFLDHPEYWDDLAELKATGLVEKIGFSLYFPSELDILRERKISFDMVQVPYSVLDRRFEREFKSLKGDAVEIHVRSVYLQGLVFKGQGELVGQFEGAREPVSRLHAVSRDLGVSVSALCQNFVAANDHIDRMVMGVDNLQNMKENISNHATLETVKKNSRLLDPCAIENEDIILPFRWKEYAPTSSYNARN